MNNKYIIISNRAPETKTIVKKKYFLLITLMMPRLLNWTSSNQKSIIIQSLKEQDGATTETLK